MESIGRTTRRKVLAVGGKSGALALALMVTLGRAGTTRAQQPGSGGDTHQRQCRSMYDRPADLRNEYKLVGLANPNSPRLDAILAELRTLGSDWIAIGCKDRYGSIASYQQPNGHWVDVDDLVTTVGEWSSVPEQLSGGAVTPGADEHGTSDASPHHNGKGKRKKGKRGKRGRR